MRLLLLFLLCYFIYRYGRYLLHQVHQNRQTKSYNGATRPPHQHYNTTSAPTGKTSYARKQDGEYIDYEEIND